MSCGLWIVGDWPKMIIYVTLMLCLAMIYITRHR